MDVLTFYLSETIVDCEACHVSRLSSRSFSHWSAAWLVAAGFRSGWTELGWAGLGWAGLVGNGMGLQLKFRLTHCAAEAAWRERAAVLAPNSKQDIDLAGLGTL